MENIDRCYIFHTLGYVQSPSCPLTHVAYCFLAGHTLDQSVTSRSREFPVPGILLLLGWYRYRYRKKLVPEKSTGTGTGKIWPRKKVPVPVPKKFGPGKKYRSRYRKKLVPEKSTGTGIGENWSRYRRIPGNSRSLYILISSCTLLQICNAFPAESSPSSI